MESQQTKDNYIQGKRDTIANVTPLRLTTAKFFDNSTKNSLEGGESRGDATSLSLNNQTEVIH